MTTIINHKHESTNGIRVSKKKCAELAEAVNYLHNVNVTFYGRNEWDATGKSYVLIAERDELHAFKTQAEAYFFMSDLEWELTQAEQAAEDEAIKPETIETTITQEQANELHTLRIEKALSWYELAQRYGITDDEARRVYNAIHSGKAVSTIEATTVDADGEVADEGTTVDERGEIVESDEQPKATKKSYARNGHGQVCAFESRQERDTFVRLVNERVSGDGLMAPCTAREAYAVRDKVDEDGEVGSRYYDMNVIEFFDGDWDVFDQMHPTTEQATTTDESDEKAIDLSHMNTAAWQVACACCLVGTGCITNHFANNYLFRDDFDAALAENVREARGMVAECIDRADEFRIEGEELNALADELRMLDAWLDANEATIITVSGEGYELTAYETEDGWQALGRIGGYDIDTVWCDCHGLSFDDLDSVILHVFESERRDRMMLAG